MSPRALRLIGRYECELCEHLAEMLAPYEAAGVVVVEQVDVDEDPALQAVHAYRVPVLLEGGRELLWGRIEASEVVQVLGDLPVRA